MPLDATDYSPWNSGSPLKQTPFWKQAIQDFSITEIGVISALAVGAFVGAAIDGFPPPPGRVPPLPGSPPASLAAQAGATASLLLVLAALVRWQARRFFREIDAS